MFRKKSLKVKLSLILIGMVLLISVSSVLLSNIFLKRFYLAKKNQTLISTFEKIDDMYAAELQGKTTESGESGVQMRVWKTMLYQTAVFPMSFICSWTN